MEEAPEKGKESPHSAHANGMNLAHIRDSVVDKNILLLFFCLYALVLFEFVRNMWKQPV